MNSFKFTFGLRYASTFLPAHRIKQILENPALTKRGNPLDLKKLFLYQHYSEILVSNRFLFVIQLLNLKSSEMLLLKRELKKSGLVYTSVRNTLFSRVVKDSLPLVGKKEQIESDIQFLRNMFVGECGVIFTANGTEAGVINALGDAVKSLKNKIIVVGGKLDSDILSSDQMQQVLKLDSMEAIREELVRILSSPAEGLVRMIEPQRVTGELVRVLEANGEQMLETLRQRSKQLQE
ncbi:hypothetical protein HK098_001801 [Nowakowskiella sp. JEL0407]|nr:hypothetical protein HK098_001801 [Nowakowskiella sp. JEL0407]